MKTNSHHLRSLIFLVAIPFSFSTITAQDPANSNFGRFLEKHCFDCHSGESPEGGLNLKIFSKKLYDAEVRRRWVFLHDRVAAGEMPPASETQPTADEKSGFLKTLSQALVHADQKHRKSVLRRLNRREYENTVRDLFDIYVEVGRLLPDDSVEQGFDTTASALSLSAEQMVLYVDAADLVLKEIFGPEQKPQGINRDLNFKTAKLGVSASERKTDDGVVLFSSAKMLPLYESSTRTPGLYRVRMQVRAEQTKEPIVMHAMGGGTGEIAAHSVGFYEIHPGKLQTIEFTGRAYESGDNFMFGMMGGYPWWSVSADSYQGAGIFFGDIHVEGPIESWPRKSRTRLLGEVDVSSGTLADIRSVLSKQLPFLFRRTTAIEEVEPYVALAKEALSEGLSFEKALRRGLKGMLCAPEFLFLEERSPKSTAQTATIDDFALASRLSYFLWSSFPDRELLSLAHRNELHNPAVLRAQVERMLGDRKSKRFVEDFTGQWLRLDDIDFTVPDRRLYPEYNVLLRKSMLDESHAFFREILENDLGIQNFIDSDFVTINKPLADFYGIAGVKGLDSKRVELPKDSLRGGVLTQASVLKVSADGTRTSPVLRGTWILKYLYGTPSPPPPPSVEAIEPDIRGATTIREQLAKHREHESCNRCHRKIDPPGFALESFDVIGAQRDWYRNRSGKYVKKLLHPQNPRANVQYRQGADIDASGAMPDGREFADIRQYKKMLLANKTALPRSLVRMLLTYSTGHELGFSDRAEVERIVATIEGKNYGLRSLVHEVVQSPTFRSP